MMTAYSVADPRPLPDAAIIARERDSLLRDALADLSPRDRDVIEWRFLGAERVSLDQVARWLGCCRARAAQIEQGALHKLKRAVVRRKLRAAR